ncbi:MAG: helix-turn-helix domain-containing protein, partial [Tetragenococcus koreensis]|nr:helix-turn-helix domain-containing protein [Tetragenococcus koreensis]
IDIADKLYINNFNITKASEELFMHKNTLTYEIRKYEKTFGIDIRGSFQGKVIFYLISLYFKKIKFHKQAGDDN